MGHSLQIFVKVMPLHTHVFSFTHNAVVLSAFRCVHPENQTKIFDFYILWIKTNVAYTRLEMITRTKYCTTTTASNWFVTLYYKLLPAVRSSSKHGRRWSSLLLYSISMLGPVANFRCTAWLGGPWLAGRQGWVRDFSGKILELSVFHAF